MVKIMRFCFLLLLLMTTLSVAQGKDTRIIAASLRVDSWRDSIMSQTNLIAIQQFILKQGKRQTYCSMYNNNPFYGVDNYSFYLTPDTGQGNINCDPEKSGFHTLVIRNMDWGQDQYREIIFKNEHDINIIASWPRDDLTIERIREKTEEALKVIIAEMESKKRQKGATQ